MPYEILVEERGIIQRYSGFLSRADIEQSNRDLYGHPDYDRFEYLISDGTAVEGFEEADAGFIEELASVDAAASLSNPRLRVAMVIDHPVSLLWVEHYRALSQQIRSSWEIEIFRTLAEARAWLGC